MASPQGSNLTNIPFTKFILSRYGNLLGLSPSLPQEQRSAQVPWSGTPESFPLEASPRRINQKPSTINTYLLSNSHLTIHPPCPYLTNSQRKGRVLDRRERKRQRARRTDRKEPQLHRQVSKGPRPVDHSAHTENHHRTVGNRSRALCCMFV